MEVSTFSGLETETIHLDTVKDSRNLHFHPQPNVSAKCQESWKSRPASTVLTKCIDSVSVTVSTIKISQESQLVLISLNSLDKSQQPR
jgi:hypothetical protein